MIKTFREAVGRAFQAGEKKWTQGGSLEAAQRVFLESLLRYVKPKALYFDVNSVKPPVYGTPGLVARPYLAELFKTNPYLKDITPDMRLLPFPSSDPARQLMISEALENARKSGKISQDMFDKMSARYEEAKRAKPISYVLGLKTLRPEVPPPEHRSGGGISDPEETKQEPQVPRATKTPSKPPKPKTPREVALPPQTTAAASGATSAAAGGVEPPLPKGQRDPLSIAVRGMTAPDDVKEAGKDLQFMIDSGFSMTQETKDRIKQIRGNTLRLLAGVKDFIFTNPPAETLQTISINQKVLDLVKGLRPDLSVHVKGYNYCGPGTDIVGNFINGVPPVNALDAICLMHDIRYLGAQNEVDVREADEIMLREIEQLDPAERGQIGEVQVATVSGLIRAKVMAEKAGFLNPMAFIEKLTPIGDVEEQVVEKQLETESVWLTDLVEQEKRASRIAQTSRIAQIEQKAGEGDDPEPTALAPGGAVQFTQILPPAEVARTRAAAAAEPEEEIKEGLPRTSSSQRVPPGPMAERVGARGEGVSIRGGENVGEMRGIPTTNIVGERYMRPLLFQGNADSVTLSKAEEEDNQRWFENFSWVDSGWGNGNQQRLPWNDPITNARSGNTILDAQKRNQRLRFAGKQYYGPAEYRPSRFPSGSTRRFVEVPMIPTTQIRQQMMRANALPARPGPIRMPRENDIFPPMKDRNSLETRLYYPDLVDGSRL
jgi:hypothetical protein